MNVSKFDRIMSNAEISPVDMLSVRTVKIPPLQAAA